MGVTESVLHQCIYGHKWRVTMPFGYVYLHPRWRFCSHCLEEGRIEVASIQLTTTGFPSPDILYTCPLCEKDVRIALIPDWSFSGLALIEDLSLEKAFEPKTGWYHLPKRWPSMCEHRAGLEGVRG